MVDSVNIQSVRINKNCKDVRRKPPAQLCYMFISMLVTYLNLNDDLLQGLVSSFQGHECEVREKLHEFDFLTVHNFYISYLPRV